MNGILRTLTLRWVALCVVALVASATRASGIEPSGARARFALLIGVGKYRHLSEAEQLDGCRNDVLAMKQVLLTRFGFAEADITTLLDEKATANGIRTQFELLKQRVSKTTADGQQATVVLHFSGHGSQVLDQSDDRDEPDGLDETLVPFDATKQGGDADIRDDELYELASDICRHDGAHLWVVLDCCHSGTGARGVTKVRKIQRELQQPHITDRNAVQLKRLPRGAVFLSACRAEEVEPEYRDGELTYGLLSRFLVQVLNEEANISNLSYDVLRQAVITRYRGDRAVMMAPMPTLECGDAQRLSESIVAGDGLDRRPMWEVRREENTNHIRMFAGALHGVTAGSLFEVYDSPESIDWNPSDAPQNNSNIWLEVATVEGGTALCRPFQWQGEEKRDLRLPPDWKSGFAIERYHHHGDFRLRARIVSAIDLQQDGPALAIGDERIPAPIRDVFVSASGKSESVWLECVGDDQASDVVVRFHGDYAAIFPASGIARVPSPNSAARDISAALIGGWGPISLRDRQRGSVTLKDYLRRIARAKNLLAIAARRQSPSGATGSVAVRMELMAVDEADEQYQVTKSHRWATDDNDSQHIGSCVMRDGDRYTFRIVSEESEKPVYITVLQIDCNMAIEQIHPWQAEIGADPEGQQKLPPGESMLVPGYFVCNGEEGEDPVYGQRWVVLLATTAPNQFHLLAQDGLPTTRSATSTLEALLLEEVDFKSRGGLSRRRRPTNLYDASWNAVAISWTVLPR